jgi:DNA polymerase-3 subunit beta
MKITLNKSSLLSAVIPAAGFSSAKNTIAATEGILFRTVGNDTCELSAYDLEKGMKTSVSCTVEEEGFGIINCTRFIQIVRTMPEGLLTVEIDTKSFRARIRGGKAEFELQALDGKDFPDLPELRGDRGFTIKQSALRAILQKTQFAIAVNSVRPELNGLNLKVKNGVLTAVACDGSRLSLVSEKSDIENVGTSELDFDIIIPGKAVAELMRFVNDTDENMKINVARKHIIFFIGSFILFTRLIDAQYVDYERFIPKAPKIFVNTDTAELTSALERAMLVTEEKQQGQVKSPVICLFDEGMLTVSSSSITGRVNDVIPVEQDGDTIEIGFNCRFLYDAMKVCDCERVKLSMTSPLMGMTIEPADGEDGKFLLLVLPVRLNK